MDDEFKLCWKNFQDNIASGFQNLYDRGDLVDVTLACDGKLLHAHKIVLAICSPYFQEIFITNPCKHPISKSDLLSIFSIYLYFNSILFYFIENCTFRIISNTNCISIGILPLCQLSVLWQIANHTIREVNNLVYLLHHKCLYVISFK